MWDNWLKHSQQLVLPKYYCSALSVHSGLSDLDQLACAWHSYFHFHKQQLEFVRPVLMLSERESVVTGILVFLFINVFILWNVKATYRVLPTVSSFFVPSTRF